MDRILSRKGNAFAFTLFFIVLFIGIVLFILTAYQYIYIRGFHVNIVFHILNITSLFFLFVAVSFGDKIKENILSNQSIKSRLISFFQAIYPDTRIWMGIIILYYVLAMALLSSWNGHVYYLRDIRSTSLCFNPEKSPILTLENQPPGSKRDRNSH